MRAASTRNSPPAPAGQPNGGEKLHGPGGGRWDSLHEDRPGGPSPQDPSPLPEATTLEDGTRVPSIRIHAGRTPSDEQHTVIAPDGESRIFKTSGDTQTIRDGQTGDVLSRSTFTATDLVSAPLVQPAFLPAVPLAIEGALAAVEAVRALELALSLLTVLGLTAHEFDPASGSQPALTPWVGKLNQQALDGACPRNGEVRVIVNDVTNAVRASGNYRNPTDFGNQVHIEVLRRVNSQIDPDFTAEMLINPSGRPLKPRKSGNIRLDLIENVRATQTVCAYDHKTGNSGITMTRAAQRAAGNCALGSSALTTAMLRYLPSEELKISREATIIC